MSLNAIITAVITGILLLVFNGVLDVDPMASIMLTLAGILGTLCLWPVPVPPKTERLYRQRSHKELAEDRAQLDHEHAALQADYELQDSVFEVSAELVGCVDGADARHRFASALRTWWSCSAVDLFVWEKGQWHTIGGAAHGDEPQLSGPIAFPDSNHNDLTIDLSAAVAGQAAIVLRDAKIQPSLRDSDDNNKRYVAEVLRGQLALSLRRVMLFLELEQLGRTDPLTQCYRRWYGEQRLSELVVRGMVVAVAMLDIDYFKQINDEHGHSAGDQVLKAVGLSMPQQLRTGDLVCRYGGEEFLVCLPDTSVQGALQVAERLRIAIEGIAGSPLPVTVSIGVAALRIEESMHELMIRVDQALYQAKEQGRNRVVLAEGDDLVGDTATTTGGFAVRTTQRRQAIDVKPSGTWRTDQLDNPDADEHR